MAPESTEIAISILFGIFGFIIAFFMRKSINIAIFTIFTYATFMALDRLNFQTDWVHFNNLAYTLGDLGRAIYGIVGNMLETASTFSLIAFVSGGIAGLTFRRSGN